MMAGIFAALGGVGGMIRLAGLFLAISSVVAGVGWVGHLVERHKTDQAELAIAGKTIADERATNVANLDAFADYKAETQREKAALVADAEASRASSAELADQKAEIARVPNADVPVGPALARLFDRLRGPAAAAGSDHANQDRAAGRPGDAVRLPGRPGDTAGARH